MNLLRLLLQSSRKIVIVSAIAGAVAGATGIALVALVQIELSRASASPVAVMVIFASLCVVSALTRVIGHVGMVKLGQHAISKLSLRVVRRALELPLRAFEAIDTSAFLAVLTEDIVLIANALVAIPHLCINVPIVIACLIYIGWLSPLIFVSGVFFATPAIAASVVLSANGVRELRQARAGQDALVGHFRTLIYGFRELKLHRGRRHSYLADSLEPSMAIVRGGMIRGLTCFAFAEGWSQLAFFGFIGVLLFAIARIEPIGRETLVAAVLIVLYLMSPLDIILTWLPILGRARASLQKVEDLIPVLEPLAEEVERSTFASKELTFRNSVSLEGVTFTYRDRHDCTCFRLEPVDLTLRRGEIVILAGGNGSGKTTLVKLISGLYKPEEGVVRLDGRVIDNEKREAFRQLFSTVYADGHLFANFDGLAGEALEEKACALLERLGLAPLVSVEGRSFSTVLLSQGQRRRLALLGLWLEDRPICILDEAAANQDLSFKQVYYYELLPELRAAGKSVLVISHDESYFDVADRVIRLSDGHLVDESPIAPSGQWACPV
jgi:putative ATP-binding cassette transporter